jgi:hypothetical protein
MIRKKQIDHIYDVLNDCELLAEQLADNYFDDIDFSDFTVFFKKNDESECFENVLRIIGNTRIKHAMFVLTTLMDNCVDKTLDHIDFNRKINAAFEAVELLKEMRGFAPYSTNNRERIDLVLAKFNEEEEEEEEPKTDTNA